MLQEHGSPNSEKPELQRISKYWSRFQEGKSTYAFVTLVVLA